MHQVRAKPGISLPPSPPPTHHRRPTVQASTSPRALPPTDPVALPRLLPLSDAEERLANEQGEQLRRWVTDAGGVIHPALLLSFATPHGRGIVAATPISLAEAQQQPLIAVPERLLLTTEAALQCMGPALQPRRRWWELHAAAAPPPDPPLLLALLLASERRKGGGSFWWPYIAALPEEPPCAWAMPPACLGAALEELGSLAAGWGPAVRAASAAVDRRCEAAAAAYGAALGGVTAADMRWALGHVVSRSFGSGALPKPSACCRAMHARWLPGRSCSLARLLAAFRSTPLSPVCAHSLQAQTWPCCPSSTSAITGSTRPSRKGARARPPACSALPCLLGPQSARLRAAMAASGAAGAAACKPGC